tara:strand:+ start:22208 stop:24250 length:2043 start_codon:yes stop_codon:yes gene_type:complete
MLKLKNYSFSGIGRFVEKQTVNLENRDSVIQIDGENVNTGGSSGAGKSTTVEALAYLLGISDIPSTALQSRITKSPIWVQGEFEDGVTITRSKKDGLTVETPEGTVSGNSKLAEERLDEIIGVNRKLLKTMCYKRQKQGGFFLNLTPKQSHEFLVDCLDLEEFQDKILKLEDILKNQYKPNKIRLESEVNVLLESINQLTTLLGQKIEPVKPELEDTAEKVARVQVLRQAIENEHKNYLGIIQILGPKPSAPVGVVFGKEEELQTVIKETEELKATIKNNETERTTAIDQASSAIVSINSKVKEGNDAKARLIELAKDIETLLEERKHFTSGNCPTCLREWDNGQSKLEELNVNIDKKRESFSLYRNEVEKIPHLLVMQEKAEQILESKRSIVVNIEESKALTGLLERDRLLRNEKDNIQDVENQKFLKLLNEYDSKANVAKDNYNQKERAMSSEATQLESDIKQNKIKLDAYVLALDTYNKDIKNIQEKKNTSSSNLSNNQTELRKLEKDIILSEESIRLIKNFTLQKFQDTLNYIGERATEIINQIPNMANAVIFFENAKETKSGNIKNEVNAVINLEGDSKVPIKTLSGGERTSADFAIDLAVGEMIESMTKKGVNFLIIDEGFDGLDSISKIQCLEILKTLNTDKKIMMVDHSSEVKEMVCDIIKVKRINEESYIV